MANSKQKNRSEKGGGQVGGKTGASTRRASTPDFSGVPF